MIKLIGLLLLIATTPVEAAALYSNDTFDPSIGLWTYNYIVDDSSGPGNIGDIRIFIGGFPTEPTGYQAIQPLPAAACNTTAHNPADAAHWPWRARSARLAQ